MAPALQDPSLLLLLSALGSAAIDNGLGLRPPMGWRSWNLFGKNVNQKLIEGIMDGMVDRKRMVDGKPTSLCDLGYCEVGLDDMWQRCATKEKRSGKFMYHTDEGDPRVNLEVFPDMGGMTAHAHKLGLTAGWYANNCICPEMAKVSRRMYERDVAALVDYKFDAVKLDNCGKQKDINLWAKLINDTGRPIMIELCHWGKTVPNATHCQWNFFRTCGDIRANYGHMVSNLLTTEHWATTGLSRPGCWAYPDMLEVGCKHGPGADADRGFNQAETRSHFGGWCIVSSPLILSHDVNSDEVMEEVWHVIANQEAIAVNQAWAGHSGSPFKRASTNLTIPGYADQTRGPLLLEFGVPPGKEEPLPRWHYFYKPLPDGKVAVLLMNHAGNSESLALDFADIPGAPCSRCHVRDIWTHKNLGVFDGQFVAQDLASHDSAFLVIAAPGSVEAAPVESGFWGGRRKEQALAAAASLLMLTLVLLSPRCRRFCCDSAATRMRAE